MGPMSQRGGAVSSGTFHRMSRTSCVMLDLSLSCWMEFLWSPQEHRALCTNGSRVIKPAALEPAVEKGHGGSGKESFLKLHQTPNPQNSVLTLPVPSQGSATFFRNYCDSEAQAMSCQQGVGGAGAAKAVSQSLQRNRMLINVLIFLLPL